MRPQYDDRPERPADDDSFRRGSRVNQEATPAPAAQQNNRDETSPSPQEHPPASVSTAEFSTATNPLKRKYVETEAERWLFASEELDLAQHLPSQAVLLKVVDFFTTSFHHWIPYLHKQRLHNKVHQGTCSNGLLLVLHALVAVALRHMDTNILFMDNEQIQRQSDISRIIVETHAIRSVSVESLQALVFIVFDYVSVNRDHQFCSLHRAAQ